MFWVFCNSCFIKPNQGNKRNFYMTSCSHIFCDHCILPGDTLCRRCQTSCMIVPCNSEMPDEVKDVFCEPTDNPTNLIKAFEFQEIHRKRLMMHYKSVVQKYNNCKVIVNNLQQNLSILEQRYQLLKQTAKNREEVIIALERKLQMYQKKADIQLMPISNQQPVSSKGNTSHLNFQVKSGQKPSMNQQNFPQKSTPKQLHKLQKGKYTFFYS